MTKPRVGMFSFTACQGCQLELFNLEDIILEILDKIELVNCKLLSSKNIDGNFDIAIVEGGIATREEVDEIKSIREKSKFLIALGACATCGGLMPMRNVLGNDELKKMIYDNKMKSNVTDVSGIGKYVNVDYYMRGCPVDRGEFVRVIKDLLQGKKPQELKHPVCFECRLKENECVLEKGMVCMGPITNGGCGAICPSEGGYCEGCREPMSDANVPAQIELLENCGLSDDDIKRLLAKYGSLSEKFKDVLK